MPKHIACLPASVGGQLMDRIAAQVKRDRDAGNKDAATKLMRVSARFRSGAQPTVDNLRDIEARLHDGLPSSYFVEI